MPNVSRVREGQAHEPTQQALLVDPDLGSTEADVFEDKRRWAPSARCAAIAAGAVATGCLLLQDRLAKGATEPSWEKVTAAWAGATTLGMGAWEACERMGFNAERRAYKQAIAFRESVFELGPHARIGFLEEMKSMAEKALTDPGLSKRVSTVYVHAIAQIDLHCFSHRGKKDKMTSCVINEIAS